MIVCKAFLSVIKNNIVMIIIYSAIFLIFGIANSQIGDSVSSFENSKPPICLDCNDDSAISKCLKEYLENNAEIKDVPEKDRDDALFYKEISCVVMIPENYGKDAEEGKRPEIQIKTAGNYNAEFVKLMLGRFTRVLFAYADTSVTEHELVNAVSSAMESTVNAEIANDLDEKTLIAATNFFNFAAYSMMACQVFIICLVLSSFNERMIRSRTIVSSMPRSRYNFYILISSGIYSLVIWLALVLISLFVVRKGVMSDRGIYYIANAFLYMLMSLSMAFMLSTFLRQKNAISGIVNVITLGCSFLCGIFVPEEYLSDVVKTIAHALPPYWYVQTNEWLRRAESLAPSAMTPVWINYSVLFGFAVLFFAAGLVISAKKSRIDA